MAASMAGGARSAVGVRNTAQARYSLKRLSTRAMSSEDLMYGSPARPGPEERLRRLPEVRPAQVEWNLTPLEVRSWPKGDSGLMGGLKG